MLRDPNGIEEQACAIEHEALARHDLKVACTARIQQGRVQFELNDLEASLAHFREAERLAQAGAYWAGEVDARCRIGGSMIWLGQTTEAEPLLRATLADARALNDPRMVCRILNNLAALCSTTSRHFEAIEFHAEEMAIEAEEGFTGDWLLAANNLSVCYLDLHDFEATRSTCLDALDQLTIVADDMNIAPNLLHNLAEAESRLGFREDARRHFDEAINGSIDIFNTCKVLLDAGDLAREDGDLEAARGYYERLVMLQETERTVTDRYLLAMGRWGIEATTGTWTRSTADELEAMLAANIPPEHDIQIDVYEALGASYEGLGDYPAALRHYHAASTFREDFWNQTFELHAYSSAKALQTREARRKADSERSRREELDRLLQQVVRLNEENEALIAQLQEQATQLEHLSRQDALTGLVNRRGFDEVHTRLGPDESLTHAVILVDIDDFKQINDTHTHHIGDRVLREVANILRSAVRSTDIVGRYGGEEFVILLKDQRDAVAMVVAERMRRAVEAFAWESIGAGLAVTISIGLWNPRLNESPADSLHQADLLLYQAKRTGKNRVVTGPFLLDRIAS